MSGIRPGPSKAPAAWFRLIGATLLLSALASGVAAAPKPSRFDCGGEVETKVWSQWDETMHDFVLQRLLRERLLKQSDVYALYDFQTYTHNMVSMARRCTRPQRLREVAVLIRIAYGALEAGTPFSPGRRWVCRGGIVCNRTNRLLNTEVMLDSVQFLGLATSVANAMAASDKPLDAWDTAFISDTVRIATEHLLRWGDDSAIERLRKASKATSDDLKNGSSALLFTDKDLWLMAIYAELSPFLPPHRGKPSIAVSAEDQASLRRHVTALLQFFAARVAIQRQTAGRITDADIADLDRGYWRYYADNRYAGYDGEKRPVTCLDGGKNEKQSSLEVRISADSVRLRPDIGWDISHARRLVPALDAVERNRAAMVAAFSLNETQLPPIRLPAAFASALEARLWNGDATYPLFSNYWSGANGWYRVAYDNGTGQCREGFPPYGMTEAFATGGYIAWARYRPVIGLLGKRLYDLTSKADSASATFISRYYPTLGDTARPHVGHLARFMFYPALVGAGIH